MARLGRMHEEGGRAGGSEGGRELARHVAGLAEAGDDDAALGAHDQIDGRGKRAAERSLQGRGNCRNAAAFGFQRS